MFQKTRDILKRIGQEITRGRSADSSGASTGRLTRILREATAPASRDFAGGNFRRSGGEILRVRIPSSEEEIDRFLNWGLWVALESTYCRSVRYDDRRNLLMIEYNDGVIWNYAISKSEAEEMIRSHSRGVWIWDHIRVRGTIHDHQVAASRGEVQ